MPVSRREFFRNTLAALLASYSATGHALDPVADMAERYRAEVDRTLSVTEDEARRYAAMAGEALSKAGVTLDGPQYFVLVDRNPHVQALLLFFGTGDGQAKWVGASPVSTGLPGSFEHFKTPLGVFEHSTANPDFRAEGTRNSNGIRGYGVKGMRVYDFGWQQAPKGWGDGVVSQMRLQMHATDPTLLERRLGSAQSKGCIRIPASLNRLLDHYGLLDADYDRVEREGKKIWVLDALREPVERPGRYLIIVESARDDRPDWSPAPAVANRKP